jgi:hypothetical protein
MSRSAISFFIFLILMTSCRQEQEPVSLTIPPTPVLTSESTWGVSNKPYLKVLSVPDSSSEVRGLLRRGDIVEIVSKRGADDGHSYWLEIRTPDKETSGWIPDSSMDIYDSPAQARTARDGMTGTD